MQRQSLPSAFPADRESDEATAVVVESAAEVHRRLGPGLGVEAYAEALAHELCLRGAAFQRRVAVPVFYRGVRLDAAHRMDLCVQGSVAVDVRTVDAILAVHRAELRAKLRVSGLPSGVLVNFRTARFGEGLVILRRATLRGQKQLPLGRFALVEPGTGAGEPAPAPAEPGAAVRP